jgi:peroxiredoxin
MRHIHTLSALFFSSVFALAVHAGEVTKDAKAPEKTTPPAVVNESAAVGAPAPDFTLTDENGKTHTLAQYKGKTVVLEWTNPDCPFVKRHAAKGTMPTLANAWAKRDVVWLAVNSTHSNTAEKSRAYRAEKALPYPTLQDASGTVGKLYGAKTTPHMFVIDEAGVLRYMGAIDDDPHGDGEKPSSYVESALTAVTTGKAPASPSTKPYGCSVKYKS